MKLVEIVIISDEVIIKSNKAVLYVNMYYIGKLDGESIICFRRPWNWSDKTLRRKMIKMAEIIIPNFLLSWSDEIYDREEHGHWLPQFTYINPIQCNLLSADSAWEKKCTSKIFLVMKRVTWLFNDSNSTVALPLQLRPIIWTQFFNTKLQKAMLLWTSPHQVPS